ncbi:hypothetical protein [Cryobacterium sp. AP23]
MENTRGVARPPGRMLVGVAGVALALAGCASLAPATGPAAAGPSSPPAADASGAEIYAACAPPGVVDYDPVDSLASLAASSRVVVQGRIERIQAGRTSTDVTPAGPGSQVNSVIVVSDVTVVDGALDSANDGHVYIEFAPAGLSTACAETLPDDTRIVAYLKPAWDGVQTSGKEVDHVTELTDPGAGRPAGQALYMAAALEGLVWQPPGSLELIWPLYLGAGAGDIRDTLPDGTRAGPHD